MASRVPKKPADSLREYYRGIAGGLLFSVPLLYTMEVWWSGFLAQPLRLLAGIGATFVLLLGYNRFAGLHEDASFAEVAIDSVEELGIGLVLSALVLYLTGQIGPEVPFDETVGKIVVEGLVVAIGVSVGTAQLGAGERERGTNVREGVRVSLTSDLVLGMCGAVLLAANVAPTDEIRMIAAEAGAARLLGLSVFSMALGSLVLHHSEFSGSERLSDRLRFGHRIDSAVTYALALAVSAALLWFFGRFDTAGFSMIVSQTVVLALPAVIGAAAGRLLLA